MNQYVTGAMIKELRERNNLTQLQLAERIGVSDKTVSKWETGKGYPDISLLEPIAKEFSISVAELIAGNVVRLSFTVMECALCRKKQKKRMKTTSCL